MWLLSDKVRVRDSGLLEGFCDYHCHLLPGVDDGVQKMEETLEILKMWDEVGVKEVWMTPHVMEDYPNEPTELREKFEQVRNTYSGNIVLHLAAENMMDLLFMKRLNDDHFLTIGEAASNLLVETSYYIPPMNMDLIVSRIKEKGYSPILAHPERYQYMELADYRKWKNMGVLLQLNIPSLVGAYGYKAQANAKWLLSHGMYDCCGTDTHSIANVEEFLDSMISKKTVRRLRQINR
jgi:tyrosine-protein phosphatase YwqE